MKELSDQMNNNLNSALKVYLRLKPVKKCLFVFFSYLGKINKTQNHQQPRLQVEMAKH